MENGKAVEDLFIDAGPAVLEKAVPVGLVTVPVPGADMVVFRYG